MTLIPARSVTERSHSSGSPVVWHWIAGLLGSWLVVWLLGPYVLDTILIRTHDPDLRVNTLRPGDAIRWRSEGWATTHIGPHGLPGWSPLPTDLGTTPYRVVIWGDSQVEGVCIADPDKIHSQVIRIAQVASETQGLPSALDCLPMGRSGADARDWRDLLSDADALWDADLHVWVVTEISDLTIAVSPDAAETYRRWTDPSPAWVVRARDWGAEAAMAAGKRIFRDPDTGQLRRLDFRLGPRPEEKQSFPLEDGYPADSEVARLSAPCFTEFSMLPSLWEGRSLLRGGTAYLPDRALPSLKLDPPAEPGGWHTQSLQNTGKICRTTSSAGGSSPSEEDAGSPRENLGIPSAATSPNETAQNEIAQRETLGHRLAAWINETATSTGGRLAIVYAPATPRAGDGLLIEHPDDAAFNELARQLERLQIPFRDVRPTFFDYWYEHRRFPRGFHNGIPSLGHLNPAGNKIVAEAIVDLVREHHTQTISDWQNPDAVARSAPPRSPWQVAE